MTLDWGVPIETVAVLATAVVLGIVFLREQKGWRPPFSSQSFSRPLHARAQMRIWQRSVHVGENA